MSLTLHAPCTRVDLAEIAGDVPAVYWAAASAQIGLGLSFAFRRADGVAVAAGGYVPLGDAWEAWFQAGPAAGAHMLAFTRLVRLTLRQLPEHDPRPVETLVRTRAGARLARACGYSRVLAVDGIELWRHRRWAAL